MFLELHKHKIKSTEKIIRKINDNLYITWSYIKFPNDTSTDIRGKAC